MDPNTEKQLFIAGAGIAVVAVVFLARRGSTSQGGGYVPGSVDNTLALADVDKELGLAQITADTFKAALGFKFEGERLASETALAGRQSEIARDIAFRTADRASEAQIETARHGSAAEIARAAADKEITIARSNAELEIARAGLTSQTNAELSRQALELQKAQLSAQTQAAQQAAQAKAVEKVASAQKTGAIFNGIFSTLNNVLPLIFGGNRPSSGGGIFGGIPGGIRVGF